MLTGRSRYSGPGDWSWCSTVTPIQALQAGADRIGAGVPDQRIDVRTGDELESLAEQFNAMVAQLRESYANLEQKVEDRTREVAEKTRRAGADRAFGVTWTAANDTDRSASHRSTFLAQGYSC